MGGFASIVRGALAGLSEAAGSDKAAGQWEAANAAAAQKKLDEQRVQWMPHAVAIKGLQKQLEGLDATAPEYSEQAGKIKNAIRDNWEAVQGIIQPQKSPEQAKKGNFIERAVTDRLHLTHPEKREAAAGEAIDKRASQAQQAAEGLAQGVNPTPNPYVQERQQLINAGFTQEQADEAIKIKAGVETKPSAMGNWVAMPGKLKDGTHVSLWRNTKDNSITDFAGHTMAPEQLDGFVADPKQTKPERGTMVPTKQSPTGFAQTWVDAYKPGKVVAWQPVAASRYYQGTTTSGISTDAFGVTTRMSRTTSPILGGDVDLSEAMELPAEGEISEPNSNPAPGEPTANPGSQTAASSPATTPNAPSTAAAQNRQPVRGSGNVQVAKKPILPKHAKLQTIRSAQTGADPYNTNPFVRAGVDFLLNKGNVKNLPVSTKDKPLVLDVAKRHGWEAWRENTTSAEQKYLDEMVDPSISMTDDLIKKIKDAGLENNNTPGYFLTARSKYALGMDPGGIGSSISAMSLDALIAASTALQGSSRAISALRLALVHTPNPWKDSPKNVITKLENINNRLKMVKSGITGEKQGGQEGREKQGGGKADDPGRLF